MSNITKLPTAAESYITIRKAGAVWHVQIVTPCGSMPALRTTVEVCANSDLAAMRGADIAASMKRPFKMRGVSA